jgi:hypothetical protein
MPDYPAELERQALINAARDLAHALRYRLLCGNAILPDPCNHIARREEKRKIRVDDGTEGRLRPGGQGYIYRCYGKDIHKLGCDGQSLYSAAKIEESVLKTVHHVFQKIHDRPLMELTAKQLEQKPRAVQARLDSLRGEKAKLHLCGAKGGCQN